MANVSDNTVEYVIKATDATLDGVNSAKRNLEGIGSQSRSITEQMSAHWNSFKTNWLAVTAGIYAGFEVLRKAWDLAEMAASYNEQMQLLDGLAQKYGTTATSIVDSIRQAGEGMISMATAAETANAALSKGLTPDHLTQLARAAVVLSDVMGTTADDAFKRLTEAMEAGKEKTLKLAVGVIDLKDRYGEAAGKMSEVEKQAAYMQIVMEKVDEIQRQTAGSGKSLADEMETLGVTIKDLQLELGQGIIRAGAAALGAFQYLAAGVLGLTSSIFGLISAYAKYREWVYTLIGDEEKAARARKAADEAMISSRAAWEARNALLAKSSSNFKLMAASTEDLTKATAANTSASERAGQAEQTRQGAIKETQKALEAYAKVVGNIGEEELKIAKSGYTEALKLQNATVGQLQASTDQYLATLAAVYRERIEGEKAVADAMAAAGVDPQEIQKQQAEILKTEKEYALQRKAVWTQYYETLKTLNEKAVDQMKSKTQELQKLQSDAAAQQRTALEQQLTLREKLLMAQGKAATDESIYNMKRQAAEDLYQAAMQKTGAERIAGLQAAIAKHMELTNEVTRSSNVWDSANMRMISGQEVIISKEEATKKAMEEVNLMQTILAAEQGNLISKKQEEIAGVQQWKGETEAAMGSAQAMMAQYIAQVLELSRSISGMDKDVALNVKDEQAKKAIAQVAAMLKAIPDEEVTLTLNYLTTGGGGGGGNAGGSNNTGASNNASQLDGSTKYPSFGNYSVSYDADGNVTYTPETRGSDVQGSYGSDGNYYITNAMGNVFDRGDVIPFANGGIFSRPTLFPMTGGRTGVLGEDGPEAIMPIEEGRNGRLGIRASGVRSNQTVNFTWTGNVIAGDKSPRQLAREIAKPLKEELQKLEALVNG